MFGVLVFAPNEVKAQPVSDRAVIPVAITLNQVLRLNITNGGNIEFVFNQIGQYTSGINAGGTGSNAPFYTTEFDIASSTRWELDLGAEDPIPCGCLQGTDNPANQLALDNVGLQLFVVVGASHTIGVELLDASGAFATTIGLPAYPPALPIIGAGSVSNAGDETDNNFTIVWRAGTAEPGMNPLTLINQVPTPEPDRYVVNVLLDLEKF